jgi:hypothetical protein
VKLVASPCATEAVAGLTEIESNAGAVTVNVALSVTVPLPGTLTVAVTVAVPTAREEATPLLSTVTTFILEETQLTEPDTSAELPSE